jgi:hypothetical protein
MNRIYRTSEAAHQANILAVLAATDAPLCRKQFAQQIDLCGHRLLKMLRLLLADKKIHIVHVLRGNRYYRPGAAPAAVPSTQERILAALAAGPTSMPQLVDQLGITYGYLNMRLNELHAAKQIYVAKQIKQANLVVRLWAIGDKPDAPRPKRLTTNQKYKRKLAKLKTDPEWVEARERRQKVKAIVSAPAPDAWMAQFAGLFGQRMAA